MLRISAKVIFRGRLDMADIIPPIAPGVKPPHLGLYPSRGAMGPQRRRVALRQRLTFSRAQGSIQVSKLYA
jgi:hypothetical protein